MKIVYLITANMQSKGGHYYSLKETASAFSQYEDVRLVSVGINRSPILERFNDKYIHIDYQNILHTTIKVLKVIKTLKPNIIHAFDINSFYYARLASLIYKVPVIITLCGGKNPKYFPFSYDAIMYSLENLSFLSAKKKFNKTNFHFIPNRSSVTPQDYEAIRKIRESINADYKIILRIARFSGLHKDSILQSMKLNQLLNNRDIKSHLLVIGYVNDKSVYDELLSKKNGNVTFLTSDQFTVNASKLIDVADYVVGSGRGFMEAALLGKVMLAPVADSLIPIAVNERNIKDVFRFNFSNRYRDERSEEEILNDIIDTFIEEKKPYLKKFAKDNFSSERIYSKHLPVYKKAKVARNLPLDIAYQALLIIKPKQKIRILLCKIKETKVLTTLKNKINSY